MFYLGIVSYQRMNGWTPRLRQNAERAAMLARSRVADTPATPELLLPDP